MRLLIILLTFLCVSAINWADFFGTPEYLVVGVSGCNISTEISIGNDFCPYHMMSDKNHSRNCESFHSALYLPSESTSMEPPQIIVVYAGAHEYLMEMADIPYPGVNRTIKHGPLLGREAPIPLVKVAAFEKLIGIVYEHTTSTLVLLYQSNWRMRAVIYMVDVKEKHVELWKDITVDRKFANTMWSTDAFNQKFFYYTNPKGNLEHASVRSIPYGQLIYHLRKGLNGKLEKSFTATKDDGIHYVQVTDNLLYFSKGTLRYIEQLQHPDTGIRCTYTSSPNTHLMNENFMVLTGWDYCKLRYGKHAKPEKCAHAKQPTASSIVAPKEMVVHAESSSILPIVLTSIVYTALFVAFLVWLKRGGHKKFNKSEHQPVAYVNDASSARVPILRTLSEAVLEESSSYQY